MADQPRVKARKVKGFRDVGGETLLQRRRLIDTITSVYDRYGFTPLETPTLEYVDVLGKFLPEADQPEGGIFALRDENEEWIALRYDLTAPLSRLVAEDKEMTFPFQRYQIGPVFRQEKPGAGRFREFYQCDFDTVGTASMAADAEVCCVLSEALEALDIPRGKYILRVNNRKILSGILERAGIPDLSSGTFSGQTLTVLRAIDKLDRVGIEGVVQLLGEGRMDPSGDYTKGAQLETSQIKYVERYLNIPRDDRATLCEEMSRLVAGSAAGEEGVKELSEIHDILAGVAHDEDRVIFDPTVVRGLAYYTGPVFEAELTFEIVDEKGEQRRFGSVAGGGRYDDLVERFLGRLIPATGASIGVDRLLAALQALDLAGAHRRDGSVLVMVMDRQRRPEYFKLAQDIRAAGIPASVYLGTSGFKAQMKHADRRGVSAVVIVGQDEFTQGTVSIKDMARGKELSAGVADRETWRKERPAQINVPLDQMIPSLKQIIGGPEQ